MQRVSFLPRPTGTGMYQAITSWRGCDEQKRYDQSEVTVCRILTGYRGP